MRTENDRYLNSNGYVMVYRPNHPRAIKSGSYRGYVYEHILVGEQIIDRPLRVTEVVHHLDTNRTNNSPDNLLVLEGPMHSKLHSWMAKHRIEPTDAHNVRIGRGCVRCERCSSPIDPEFRFCSPACAAIGTQTTARPQPDDLVQDLLTMPLTGIGRKYGVSDNAIRKWCRRYNLPFTKKDIESLRIVMDVE